MDVEGLESALNAAKSSSEKVESIKKDVDNISKEEEIGFHKGAVNILMAERNELVKMIGNVEAIASAHVRRLKELGVGAK